MHVCAFATLQSALRDLRQGLASTETLQKEAEDEEAAEDLPPQRHLHTQFK